jgi:phosphoribosylformylglycinamidine synthase
MEIFRCYVEKREGFNVHARSLENELREVLGLEVSVRIFNRYDIQNLAQGDLGAVVSTVLSEPMSDVFFMEDLPEIDGRLLCIEPIPGQFDARADSCGQCIQMLLGGERPIVKTAKVYGICGAGDSDFERIKGYIINPLEYREAAPEKPSTLVPEAAVVCDEIERIGGFLEMGEEELTSLNSRLELAMALPDLLLIQGYFRGERREPTLTEMRVFDTYWSDHCRHTTFGTVIEEAEIQDERVQAA